MATSAGPNISLDGLVFGYDSSYPISDNDIATRFSPGKPTTNLNTDPLHSTRSDGDTLSSAVWGGDAGSAEFKTNTSPDEGGLMYINKNTSNPAGTGGVYNDFPSTRFTLTNGLTYTRSWWCKSNINQTLSGHICSCNRDSDNTYIIGGSISLTTEWQRISETFTYTGPTSTDWQFRHINYNTSNVYIANVQLEVNGVASPFVNGTRADTTSLIDLTKTTNIDVSNVSFDSNAQLVFDGTDDFIDGISGVGISDYANPFSMECVFKVPTDGTWANSYGSNVFSIAGSYAGQYGIYKKSTDTIGFQIRDASTGGYCESTGHSKDVYHHVIVTFGGGSGMKLYINGELKSSNTTSFTGTPDSTNLYIGGQRAFGGSSGEWFDGEIPIAKYYDKELTSAEIGNKFNSIRKRFGI